MTDDGIKLTDDEIARLRYADWHMPGLANPAEVVESIVAARVQALTAGLEELRGALNDQCDWGNAVADRDAARAELAAANARAEAAEAELEQAWETVKAGYADLGDSTERLTAVIDRLVRERNQERFARAALSARLERVRALAEWKLTAPSTVLKSEIRAALGEDA